MREYKRVYKRVQKYCSYLECSAKQRPWNSQHMSSVSPKNPEKIFEKYLRRSSLSEKLS